MVTLMNEGKIEAILKDMVGITYEHTKGEEVLLCLECSDVDLYVAAASSPDFEDALKENFELDIFGEIKDAKAYRKTMDQLDRLFVDFHIQSGLFDYFPAGLYEVNGEEREKEFDTLAPKGIFYAPFEDAVRSVQ